MSLLAMNSSLYFAILIMTLHASAKASGLTGKHIAVIKERCSKFWVDRRSCMTHSQLSWLVWLVRKIECRRSVVFLLLKFVQLEPTSRHHPSFNGTIRIWRLSLGMSLVDRLLFPRGSRKFPQGYDVSGFECSRARLLWSILRSS